MAEAEDQSKICHTTRFSDQSVDLQKHQTGDNARNAEGKHHQTDLLATLAGFLGHKHSLLMALSIVPRRGTDLLDNFIAGERG